MAAQGTVTINIVGDANRLKAALGQAGGDLESFSSKMQHVGQTLQSIGTKMTVGITLPLALLGRAAFNAASDMNESLSKVNVVFAENAGVIKQWSKSSAESMGIARQEALEAAGTFGNLFRALGVDLDPATEMSQKLVELASDLASFNNADPTEVLLALRSGLVGEIEPLRKFGVSLSAARVEAKAMEMGLVDANGELSASAKAQAAYAIILEDTALAQGDFARTAEGAANQQRILKAELTDAAAKIGQALLPIFVKIADVVAKVADWFSNLNPKVQNLIVYAGLLVAALGPLLGILGSLMTVLAAVSLPVLAVAVAIGALVAAAVLLYLKWDEVWNAVAKHPALLLILAPLGAILIPIIALVGAIKLVQDNWGTIWPIIQAVVETAGNIIRPILSGIDSGARAIADAVKWLLDRWNEAWPTIQAVLEVAWSVMQGILAAAAGAVSAIAGAVVWLHERWNEAWPVIQSVIQAAWAVMQVPLGALADILAVINGAVGWIVDNAGAAWDGFIAAVQTMWSVVQVPLGALKAVLDGIVGAARAVKSAIDAIPGVGGGGGIGDVSDIVGPDPNRGWMNRGRAAGGPVLPWGTYLVGEDGPELLQMGARSGNIVPNHQLASSGDVTVVIVRDMDEALTYVPDEARARTQAAFLTART